MPVDLSAVDSLEAALTFHRERHTVLASNVANLDTPGFRPADLVRAAPEEPAPLATTRPGHLAGHLAGAAAGAAAGDAGGWTTAFDDGGALQGPDGNAVSLERELAKLDANRTRYATAAELVSRRMALLKYAAGDGT